MSEDPNLRYAEASIPLPADACFQALCDIERVPEWVSGVASVLVRDRDQQGRVVHAEFVGMPGRGSFAYDLLYRYDDESMTVRWTSKDRTLRDLEGEARVVAVDAANCTLIYGLHSWSTSINPMWAQMELRDETPLPVVNAFRNWLAKRS